MFLVKIWKYNLWGEMSSKAPYHCSQYHISKGFISIDFEELMLGFS